MGLPLFPPGKTHDETSYEFVSRRAKSADITLAQETENTPEVLPRPCHGIGWHSDEATQVHYQETEVIIDLVKITVQGLEEKIRGIVDRENSHREIDDHVREIAASINSIVLVWDEVGKHDWTVPGHSDEELKAVLADPKASGFSGYTYVEYDF